MKKMDNKLVTNIVANSGIADDKINKVIGTIRISLARQAAKEPDRRINLDMKTRSELEESLRIGADLSSDEAKTILNNLEKIVKEQNDPLVKFLEEGTFKVDKDEIEFKSSLD
jgi:hypothetical protein